MFSINWCIISYTGQCACVPIVTVVLSSLGFTKHYVQVILYMMREIIEQITAGGPMVRTPIILVRRPISLSLIKYLCNHAIIVQRL